MLPEISRPIRSIHVVHICSLPYQKMGRWRLSYQFPEFDNIYRFFKVWNLEPNVARFARINQKLEQCYCTLKIEMMSKPYL